MVSPVPGGGEDFTSSLASWQAGNSKWCFFGLNARGFSSTGLMIRGQPAEILVFSAAANFMGIVQWDIDISWEESQKELLLLSSFRHEDLHVGNVPLPCLITKVSPLLIGFHHWYMSHSNINNHLQYPLVIWM